MVTFLCQYLCIILFSIIRIFYEKERIGERRLKRKEKEIKRKKGKKENTIRKKRKECVKRNTTLYAAEF